eukprot:scaffold129164_cov21-Phaeocystis_antarctica.AAC.1
MGRGGWTGGACNQLEGARHRGVPAFDREYYVVGRAVVGSERVGHVHQGVSRQVRHAPCGADSYVDRD